MFDSKAFVQEAEKLHNGIIKFLYKKIPQARFYPKDHEDEICHLSESTNRFSPQDVLPQGCNSFAVLFQVSIRCGVQGKQRDTTWASYFRTSRPMFKISDTVWLSGAAYFVEILLKQFAFPVLPKLAGSCGNIDVDYRWYIHHTMGIYMVRAR